MIPLMTVYFFKTKKGTFYIRPDEDGWFSLLFKDMVLDRFNSPQQAVDELTVGHPRPFRRRHGLDSMRIAREISAWSRRYL
jgi:hypothetical protein